MPDSQIIFGAIVPLIVAILTVAAPQRTDEEPLRERAAWRWPLLLGFIVLLGHAGMSDVLDFEALFDEKWKRVFYVPILGVTAGILMSFTPRWWWLRAAIAAALGASVWMATRGVFVEADPLLAKIIPAAGTFILLCILEPLAMRERGPLLPLGMWIGTGGAAALILDSGWMSGAIAVGSMSIAMFVIAIASFFDRRLSLADGALAVVLATTVTMLDVRYVYAVSENPAGTISPIPFVICGLAPFALWTARLPWLRDRSLWLRVPLAAFLAAMVCAVAMLTAQLGRGDDAAPDDPYADMYQEYM